MVQRRESTESDERSNYPAPATGSNRGGGTDNVLASYGTDIRTIIIIIIIIDYPPVMLDSAAEQRGIVAGCAGGS